MEELNSEIARCKEDKNYLFRDNDDIIKKYQFLNEDYQLLLDQVNRFSSSSGLSFGIGRVFKGVEKDSFSSGDTLDFKANINSVLVKVVRVSNQGPIISIFGCNNYVLENEVRITENNNRYYLLKKNEPLTINYTAQSCDEGKLIEPSIAEKIILTTTEFDYYDQKINLQYQRISHE